MISYKVLESKYAHLSIIAHSALLPIIFDTNEKRSKAKRLFAQNGCYP